MAATTDNTRRRLSVDFLLNGGHCLGSLPTPTSDTSDDTSTPPAGSTASASPSTNTSPRSSGTAHATRCADVLSGTTQKLPPLASLLSSSAPAVTTAAAAHAHHRPAYQHHGRRRSWSTGGVVRPSAYIPPAQNWSGAQPDRRPVVTVATSGPLARAPPAHASRSSFFLPINALPVVIDIDRDLEDAELQHRQRQHQQQLNYQHQLQQQRQRRPQQTQMALMMQKRKHQQLAELDRDEEEVARMLADSTRWAMTVHNPARHPGAAVGPHAASQPLRGGARDRMVIAEAENVMSPAEDARRMQQHSKRRRHSAAPTLVAEAQRLFSSHLAATPILPASEAKELAAAKYGTAAASAAQPCDAMDEVPAVQTSAAVESAQNDVASANSGEDNTNAPAIAPTYTRKAEAFQFSPDQQDLLLQVLERTQQREAQRNNNGAHNSEMDYSSEGRSDSISGASSNSGGSSSGDDGDDADGDEVGRLQRMAKKRKRVNAQQLAVLEEYFAVDPMPNTLVKLKLAETLGMSPKRVQIWFQNKRARLKKGEQKKLQELQQRHAASHLLTYHNLRIDDNGHIVFKDNSNSTSVDGAAAAAESITQPQEEFVPIQPQPTTTASAM
jgi:hypothetical protein